MKHRLLLAGLLSLSGFFSFGQKPISIISPPTNLCADSDVVLPFTTTLALQQGKVFRVQLRRYVDQFTGGSSREFPAVLSGTELRARFPDPRNLGYSPSEWSNELQCRVVSSNPTGDSEWASVRFSYRPQLNAVTAQPGAVNPDEGTPVEFDLSGTAPVTLTFADCSRLDVSPPFSSDAGFRVTVPVFNDKSQTYRIVGLRNECGAGTGSGQFDVKVNPFSIRVTTVAHTHLCEGSTLQLRYSVQGGTLQPGNRFRVLLTPSLNVVNFRCRPRSPWRRRNRTGW